MTEETRWVLTVDERQGHLYSCRRVPGPRWHVNQRKSLSNSWEDYHEHHRPIALDARPGPGRTEHFGAGFSEKEEHEEARRFARDVRRWLEDAMREFGVDRICVFAASRFLAALRHELSHLGDRASIHKGELAGMRPDELARHPAVLDALESRVPHD